jgi:hypothetical protein
MPLALNWPEPRPASSAAKGRAIVGSFRDPPGSGSECLGQYEQRLAPQTAAPFWVTSHTHAPQQAHSAPIHPAILRVLPDHCPTVPGISSRQSTADAWWSQSRRQKQDPCDHPLAILINTLHLRKYDGSSLSLFFFWVKLLCDARRRQPERGGALDGEAGPGSSTQRRPHDGSFASRSLALLSPRDALETISPPSGGGLPAAAISRPLLERMGRWRRLRDERPSTIAAWVREAMEAPDRVAEWTRS